jgi:FtsH-binding integral membrane protein
MPVRREKTLELFFGLFLLYCFFGLIFKWHTNSYINISVGLVIGGICLCLAGFSKSGITFRKDKSLTGKSAKIVGVIALIFSFIISGMLLWLLSLVPAGP